jgi:hypothetical protein
VLVSLLATFALLAGPSPKDGEALIRLMHQRYQGKWYRTLTFVQKTGFPKQNRVETWYEAARIPGYLRIDITPIDSGNALVFRNDSVYRFKGGDLAASRSFVHPLMVLGFDVYADPPDTTIRRLRDLGFDLSLLREDRWQGRPVYVIGAPAGDTLSKQFWVDRARLVFTRLLEPTQDGSGHTETQFNKYRPLGRGWVSVEVRFSLNGEVVQTEEYSDVRDDVDLPEELWESAMYRKPGWVK